MGTGYTRRFGRRWEPAAVTMIVGAGCWLAGSGLWLAGCPFRLTVVWWVGFLVLTIAGERLELARVQRLDRAVFLAFTASAAVFLAGLLATLIAFVPGVRAAGIGLVLLGLWLLRFDVARHTVRLAGLSRFVAACLLPGYLWLCAAGLFWILWPDYFAGGPYYDAMLHAVLVGFVFSMIFGHAPIILPAVAGVPIGYHPHFYAHLVLLHLSLILRLWGDFAVHPRLRAWGGMINAGAILLFFGSSLLAVRLGRAAG
jgi:hypothetical protein